MGVEVRVKESKVVKYSREDMIIISGGGGGQRNRLLRHTLAAQGGLTTGAVVKERRGEANGSACDSEGRVADWAGVTFWEGRERAARWWRRVAVSAGQILRFLLSCFSCSCRPARPPARNVVTTRRSCRVVHAAPGFPRASPQPSGDHERLAALVRTAWSAPVASEP